MRPPSTAHRPRSRGKPRVPESYREVHPTRAGRSCTRRRRASRRRTTCSTVFCAWAPTHLPDIAQKGAMERGRGRTREWPLLHTGGHVAEDAPRGEDDAERLEEALLPVRRVREPARAGGGMGGRCARARGGEETYIHPPAGVQMCCGVGGCAPPPPRTTGVFRNAAKSGRVARNAITPESARLRRRCRAADAADCTIDRYRSRHRIKPETS